MSDTTSPGQIPGEVCFPPSWKVEDLARELRALRVQRADAQKQAVRATRKAHSREERAAILKKTEGRCHICGGLINADFYWEADHVLRWSVGGGSKLDNYLASHGLCNTYRWDHLPEEVQWILKVGIWARMQMERNSTLGRKMLEDFFKNEKRRESRKKANDRGLMEIQGQPEA